MPYFIVKSQTAINQKEGVVALNVDIANVTDRWCQWLISLGAVDASRFSDFCQIVKARHEPQLNGMSAAERSHYDRSSRNIGIMSDNEWIRFNEEVYAPYHPNWFEDMLIADQRSIMEKLLTAIKDKDQIAGALNVCFSPAPFEVFLASEGIIEQPVISINTLSQPTEQLRVLAREMSVQVDFRTQSLYGKRFPFEDGSFQLVMAVGWLQWTFHWELALKEITRVLAPGGTAFICYTPGCPRLQIPWTGVGEVLKTAGMGRVKTSLYSAPISRSPRAIITATKR